ncbi:hypothetical protein CG435_12965 [Pantoea ananatis]|jgi:hypothetical protein|uniref:hypothetical protein n=1 Tax=Pantoea ananas TaxID=553 RepID=UPI000CF54C53|nr:hypothetical protein [Pantoea ananatis]PQK99981.1 hypothetical protein CG435_12965 [Pantoea ananatis]REF11082.1 hypothetical protein C7428_0252 [Pantoea ananatis]
MNNSEYTILLNLYRARLSIAAGKDSYLTVLQSILRDIESKVRLNTLTSEQAEELVKLVVGISVESYGVEQLEPLFEGIEKGALNIQFDGNDTVADMVAALRDRK